jgi:hypothetical protein
MTSEERVCCHAVYDLKAIPHLGTDIRSPGH